MSRQKKGLKIDAWVNFHKPVGMSATGAVSKVKYLFGAQKAGHAGTLDPLATGILPIGLGEATKTVPYLMDAKKIYQFSIDFGVLTDSFDHEGRILAKDDKRSTESEIESILVEFIGEIEQVPPQFSAIKIDGERAYDLARSGIEFELKSRPICIDSLRLTQFDSDCAQFEVLCGKGTYVRALCRDICQRLGVLGTIGKLHRQRVGRFDDEHAFSLEKLEELRHRGALDVALLDVDTALDDIPALDLTLDEAASMKQGREIIATKAHYQYLDGSGFDPSKGLVQVRWQQKLLAICFVQEGLVRPHRLFHLIDPLSSEKA
jgi:tRNA pseudouridine55 synthase